MKFKLLLIKANEIEWAKNIGKIRRSLNLAKTSGSKNISKKKP
jgi:hypothetical protein